MIRRFLQHAFAIPRRTFKQAQDVPLVQWSQWRSANDRMAEIDAHCLNAVSMRCASCREMMHSVPRDGACPACGFAVQGTIGVALRVPRLFAISILGMGGLGSLAMLAALIPSVFLAVIEGRVQVAELLLSVVILLPLCFIVGSIVGIFSAPIVIPALRRRELRVALPLVYGGSAIITLCYMFVPMNRSVYFPLDSAVPAFVSVCILSLVAAVACPTVKSPQHDLCEQCGYDLRGNTSGVCPECGGATRPNG